MADLEKKMIKEVKQDSLVVACRFKFPGNCSFEPLNRKVIINLLKQ